MSDPRSLRLETIRLRQPNQLVEAYLYDFERVASLYRYDPHHLSSFRERYERLRSRSFPREAVAETLAAYNRSLGCGEATLAKIRLLCRPETAVVITGQQAGILTGPLYTIYKAVTAVLLAARLTEELNAPVVPVFWIAAEDHDYDEVDRLEFPLVRTGEERGESRGKVSGEVREQDRGLGRGEGQARIKKLSLDARPAGKPSVGRIPVPESAGDLLASLEAATPPSPFKGRILASLEAATAASANLADWFGRILLGLLGEEGLVVANSLDPVFRRLEAGLFRRALTGTSEVQAALGSARQRLEASRMSIQVEKEPKESHLFIYISGDRLPLVSLEDSCFAVRGNEEGKRWRLEELCAMVEQSPGHFSPNVVLRPMTQEILFPSLAYVAGPGEISYYACFADLYPVFGLEMPVIYPRAGVTLVEPEPAARLSRYRVDLTEVQQSLELRLARELGARDPVGLGDLFRSCRKELEEAYRPVLGLLSGIDPGTASLGQRNLGLVLKQVEKLERGASQILRRNNRDLLDDFDLMGLHLLPRGELQERVFNLIPYCFRWGDDLPRRLARLPLIDGPDHKVVYLE
ncbi:MAG: bacillithiol biosynthesis cysteine-adding enzyme BshC [Firmicutes bacterium]|nr:bacillithiol biosynthesis cysteine-adding enzyme BshC [Bacillota bacterium]